MSVVRIPDELLRCIFKFMSSYDVFLLRGVNKDWHELVRLCWPEIIRADMHTEMDNLNYIYEKTTTEQLLEVKLRYMLCYGQIIKRYFNFMTTANIREACLNADPELKLILLLSASLLSEDIASWGDAQAFIESENFEYCLNFFSNNLSVMPHKSIEDLKTLKSQLPSLIDSEDHIKTMMHSWLDGAFEFCILKIEVNELQQKATYVTNKIKRITINWPNKKSFIIKAFKVLKLAEVPGAELPSLDNSMITRINFILGQVLPNSSFRFPTA
mmetsp:Transcript_29101/g.52068  ORF Transcript_29101/g.52068 Transcript_29101/m.52068 type:complete len:271 (-) Transcript_29101:27-839(-)